MPCCQKNSIRKNTFYFAMIFYNNAFYNFFTAGFF